MVLAYYSYIRCHPLGSLGQRHSFLGLFPKSRCEVFFVFFIALLGPAEGLSRQEESDFLKAWPEERTDGISCSVRLHSCPWEQGGTNDLLPSLWSCWTLGWIILCCVVCSVHCGIFSSNPWPLPTKCQEKMHTPLPSYNNQNCLWALPDVPGKKTIPIPEPLS